MKFKLRSKTPEEIVGELAPDKKPPAPKKKGKYLKRISLSKKPQFVLTLGDEGAILAYFHHRKTEGRWFAPDASEENLEVFGRALANYPRASITVLFDTMDQHYSQQTLPPVSKMSVGGLLKRRASREFGRSIELQGNYLIDRSASKEWNYMLFALEVGESAQAWLDWLYTQPGRPKGIRVLPLEMGTMIRALAEKDAMESPEKYTDKRHWQYLVSYNKISGVRQVIVRDGKVIFTRLGQPLEGDASMEAGAIEQEIISTVEYLKRIGLKTIHDLHLYVIVSEDIKAVIDEARIGVAANTIMYPYEASQMLGLMDVVMPEDRFGDVLMAAFVAGYKKSAHVLWTKSLGKIRALYMAIPALRTVGVCLALGAIGWAGFSTYNYMNYSDEISRNEQKKSASAQDLAALEEQSSIPQEELEKSLELFDIFKEIKISQLNPESFLLHASWLANSLPKHMRLQKIALQENAEAAGDKKPADEGADKKEPPEGTPKHVTGELNINILVPGDIENRELVVQAQEVLDDVQPYFPYYSFALGEVRGGKMVEDTMTMTLEEEVEEEEPQLKRFTVKSTFAGTEYISTPQLNEAGL